MLLERRGEIGWREMQREDAIDVESQILIKESLKGRGFIGVLINHNLDYD